MPYYIDAGRISLDDLQKRITETDPVPGRGGMVLCFPRDVVLRRGGAYPPFPQGISARRLQIRI